MTEKGKERFVLVTTEFRGVFFGKFIEEKRDEYGYRVTLADIVNCLYWDSKVKGFLGLSVTGPTKDCKLGAVAFSATIEKVTSVVECSTEAVKAWKQYL